MASQTPMLSPVYLPRPEPEDDVNQGVKVLTQLVEKVKFQANRLPEKRRGSALNFATIQHASTSLKKNPTKDKEKADINLLSFPLESFDKIVDVRRASHNPR